MRWRSFVLIALGALVAACGDVTITTRTFGAATVGDLQAEFAYANVYSGEMANIGTAVKLFAASGANPGVCNKGGDKQGCYDADAAAIAAMQHMIDALQATAVPPRYVEPDRLLRAALARNIEGLQLRNQAIANNDQAAWTQHTAVLQDAQAQITAAYEAFPADTRPQPAP